MPNALPDDARVALERARARPVSYAVRTLRARDERIVVLLGEAHMKLGPAAALGREVVSAFALRGVETFPARKVVAGYALWFLIHLPRLLLRTLSFGVIKGSTITDAKALTHGHTVAIENDSAIPFSLHVGSVYLSALFLVFWTNIALTLAGRTNAVVTFLALAIELHMFALIPAFALRRYAWSWVLHPAITILTTRDAIMAEGAAKMLADHPGPEPAILVMGRAHLPGVQRLLIERYGCREATV